MAVDFFAYAKIPSQSSLTLKTPGFFIAPFYKNSTICRIKRQTKHIFEKILARIGFVRIMRIVFRIYAGIAQLVEHDLAKVGVASSSLVSRSTLNCPSGGIGRHKGFKIPRLSRRASSSLASGTILNGYQVPSLGR